MPAEFEESASNNIEAFRKNGYWEIPGLIDSASVEALREVARRHRVERELYFAKLDVFAEIPEIILPIVASHRVLDAAEAIIGPFVQLESFSIVGLSPGCRAGISWHRDPYGCVPAGTEFQRPLAMNLLIYLQDLDEKVGPLRLIPGSHRKPLLMTAQERVTERDDEFLHFPMAGDGILIHNNLVHSRSPNVSKIDRIHVSVIYCLTCMRTSINQDSPGVQLIVEQLRSLRNPRYLRLFGIDNDREEKFNSGFMSPDEEMWTLWKMSESAT